MQEIKEHFNDNTNYNIFNGKKKIASRHKEVLKREHKTKMSTGKLK